MESKRTIVVLLGPKGAGKSYVGRLIERELGVGFLDVESVFRGLEDAADVRAGYRAVAVAAASRLATEPVLSMELTGASEFTQDLLLELGREHRLCMIRVVAPLDTCLRRVRSRDASIHLPAPDAIVKGVHEMSTRFAADFDDIIENVDLSDAELVQRVRVVLHNEKGSL